MYESLELVGPSGLPPEAVEKRWRSCAVSEEEKPMGIHTGLGPDMDTKKGLRSRETLRCGPMVGELSDRPGNLNLHLHLGVLMQGYCRSHFEKHCSKRLGSIQGPKSL